MAKSVDKRTPERKQADANKKRAATKKQNLAIKKQNLNESLEKRPLQSEDLTAAERQRQDRMRIETSLNAPRTAAKDMDPAKNPALYAQLMSATPKAESRRKIVSRLSDQVMNPDQSLRLPGEQAVPGADWYPREHGVPVRRISQHWGIDPEVGANSSNSMSPQNNPVSERRAFAAIAKAHSEDAVTDISQAVLDLLPADSSVRDIKERDKDGNIVLEDDENGGQREKSLVPGPVKFSQMSPEQIRDLTSVEVRNAMVPDSNPKRPVLQSEIDLARIAHAGSNKVDGVRGVRGTSNMELSPPRSAPKVHTYTNNGYVFAIPHTEADHRNDTQSTFLPETEEEPTGWVRRGKYVPLRPEDGEWPERPHDVFTPEEFGGPDDNSTAQELRFRAAHAATQMPGQMSIDQFGTYDDRVHITKAIHDHITGRGGSIRGTDIGRTVRMRDLHSSAVFALSHPSLSHATDDASHISQLAKLSSQMPPVIDTWAMAGTHNYEGAIHKPAGVYQTGKALSDGTNILSSTNAAITETGLQHAEHGSIMRDAARETADRMRYGQRPDDAGDAAFRASLGLKPQTRQPAPELDLADDPDYPSTIVQGATWVENRRRAGGDSAFNDAVKKRRIAINAAHREALAINNQTTGTFLVPPEHGHEGPSQLVTWEQRGLVEPNKLNLGSSSVYVKGLRKDAKDAKAAGKSKFV